MPYYRSQRLRPSCPQTAPACCVSASWPLVCTEEAIIRAIALAVHHGAAELFPPGHLRPCGRGVRARPKDDLVKVEDLVAIGPVDMDFPSPIALVAEYQSDRCLEPNVPFQLEMPCVRLKILCDLCASHVRRVLCRVRRVKRDIYTYKHSGRCVGTHTFGDWKVAETRLRDVSTFPI